MIIGVPKEVKDHEYRIGVSPSMCRELVTAGHEVKVQEDGGANIGFSDELYILAGAKIVKTASDAYDAEMVIKVKEPQPEEYSLLREGQILFCYLHLAPDPMQTENLLKQKVVGIAYETVVDPYNGSLPLLTPMSEIAGRFSIQAGATSLQMAQGGKGVLLGGVPGVAPAKVVILGGGIAGEQAARVAMGFGADVSVLDINLGRLRQLDSAYGSQLTTIYSTRTSIEQQLKGADLVVGSVLIPGKKAPHLIERDMLHLMEPGSVLVDISIDQGGCSETSKPTTFSNPTYIVDGVVHYCVSNMPGACARSATEALTNATSTYAMRIANLGYKNALLQDKGLKEGLNVWHGKVTNRYVALDLNYEYCSPEIALN